MSRFYLALVILFAAIAIIFALQNLESVSVSFLSFTISTRVAILAFIIYVLGAATGGSLFALLRRSYEGSRRTVGKQPSP